MKLKSFGCSFIFGSDLTDPTRPGWASKITWPALIAKDLNREYHSYAWPGIGNQQIAETIIEQATIDDNSVFAIGWTWVDRYSFISPATGVWDTVRPSVDSDIAGFYYKNLHSQYQDKLASLIAAHSTISILKEKNIPYIMTYIDELMFETEWHSSRAIEELQKSVSKEMTLFDGDTFLTWTKKKGFPISETLHPLEQAHSEAVKVLYKQNTIDRLHLA